MAPTAEPGAAHTLWPLLFGNFVIGTGVMAVSGTLNEISASLQVTVATAGQLISAGGLLMCVGAPLFASFVAGWDRRRLLALAMLWYAVFQAACALAPDFTWLLVLRVLALVPPAIFTSQAAASVGHLVPPAQRGRAIATIFLGWSLASVLGMPLNALVGGALSWRAAFGMVALLALASAAWVWRSIPDGVRPPAISRAGWGAVFRSRALLACLGVTVLTAAGQFVLHSYFAPYFKAKLGAGPAELGLLFLSFGAFGVLGNWLVSRRVDRLGAGRAVAACLLLMAFSMAIFPWGSSVLLAALVCMPWALGCFAIASAQQARLVAIAPPLAGATLALNASALYGGQALGAAGGGWLIAHQGLDLLHWAGFAGLLAALGVSLLATRFARAAPA